MSWRVYRISNKEVLLGQEMYGKKVSVVFQALLDVLVVVVDVLEGVLEPREPLGGPIRHADFLHVTAFY